MDKYFNSYKEMICLHGLTDHAMNLTALTSELILVTFLVSYIKILRMFPGRNYVITLNGSKMSVLCLTPRLMLPCFVCILFTFKSPLWCSVPILIFNLIVDLICFIQKKNTY